MSRLRVFASIFVLCMSAMPMWADGVVVNTGNPDGLMAMASRPSSTNNIEIETADDFVLTQDTKITGGTFTGLLSSGSSDVLDVAIEFYHVFPVDSTSPPDMLVPTRVNSPSDVEFDSRSEGAGNLSVAGTLLNPTFTAVNSVLNGIHPVPGEYTGGEGAVTGQEVQFSFSIDPETLPAGHYFFVPQVQLKTGDFYWLSAPKPIVPPGTPFSPDLQTWIRNADLDPDWLRVGTDITHQGPFNASFSLDGAPVVSAPEPSSFLLLGMGLVGLLGVARRTLGA